MSDYYTARPNEANYKRFSVTDATGNNWHKTCYRG